MTRGSVIRGAAVLAVAALTAGAFALSPATSATKFLTKKKARKLFYTKAAADGRFLRVDQPIARGVSRGSEPPFLELSDSEQEVLDLHTLHDQGGDQRLTMPFGGRLMATATVDLNNNAGPTIGDAFCVLRANDGAEPTDMGFNATRVLPEGVGTSLAVTGSAVMPPGQYDVSVLCLEGTGDDIAFKNGHLVVWALPG